MTNLDDMVCELAASGKLDALNERLKAEPGLATQRNAGGETLLHIATRQWPKLENGADIARTILAPVRTSTPPTKTACVRCMAPPVIWS